MSKTQAISLLILKAVKEGKDISEAVDSVLGPGTYLTFASDLYARLHGKSQNQ